MGLWGSWRSCAAPEPMIGAIHGSWARYALVVLTMLFVSERSWKHHYVTVILPYTYLVSEFFSARLGPRSRFLIVAAWALSFVLMASTSTEIGGLFGEGQGHEIAQGYGAFLWAGVVLYAMVAWRVWARRLEVAIQSRTRCAGGPQASSRQSHHAGRGPGGADRCRPGLSFPD